MNNPDLYQSGMSAPDRERAALNHLARVDGPAELHAAILALLLPPPTEQAVHTWRHETRITRHAHTLWDHVEAVSGPARLPCFEQLLTRMAKQPLALRQVLLESTRRLMRSRGVVRPIDRLHWLAMRMRLGERTWFGAQNVTMSDLSEMPAGDVLAIASYSAYLARLVPGDAADASPATSAWYASVMAPWASRGLEPLRRPPDGDALVHALQVLQALAWMQRPVVVRGWVLAAQQHSRHGLLTDSAADALRLTCSLLDSPLPPELARHYSAPLQEG